jgi:hypothetical protein
MSIGIIKKQRKIMNNIFYNIFVWSMLVLCNACMNASVDRDDSILEEAGISRFDGTIYEYLQQGDSRLGLTYDSLLYVLNYTGSPSDSLLKFQELKACLQDEQGTYTLLAIPDPCFASALKNLNHYRKVNGLEGADGDLSLANLLNYRKEIDRYDANNPSVIVQTDVYEYKYQLDSITCRYVIPGMYDTDAIDSLSTGSTGQILNSIFYEYRMNLDYHRLPASGYVGAGLKDLTCYDMRNTLQKNEWVWTKAGWMDIYTRNGVIHVLMLSHEFGYGQFIKYFQKYGHEE